METVVYRVENIDGEGPYRANVLGYKMDEMMKAHNESSYHKDPHEDIGIPLWRKANSQFVCGFHSLELLKKWFNGYEEVLHSNGYKISVYSTDIMEKGDRQCVFLKNELIARWDWQDIGVYLD